MEGLLLQNKAKEKSGILFSICMASKFIYLNLSTSQRHTLVLFWLASLSVLRHSIVSGFSVCAIKE